MCRTTTEASRFEAVISMNNIDKGCYYIANCTLENQELLLAYQLLI